MFAVAANAARIAIGAALLGVFAGAQPAAAQSLYDIYAKAKGEGAFRFENKMVDEPVVARARALLARASNQ